jgi:hypothetical protein
MASWARAGDTGANSIAIAAADMQINERNRIKTAFLIGVIAVFGLLCPGTRVT